MPDPVLREPAKPVASIGKDIERLFDDMLETMYAAPGIGLAAPQVGQSLRLVTIDLGEKEEGYTHGALRMVNPKLVWQSEEQSVYEEGCLSIPGIYYEVTRPEKIKVEFMDINGKTQIIEAGGLLATCVQHEIDHLNGILFTDYLSKLKQGMVLRKMKKLKEEQAADQASARAHSQQNL